MFLLVKFIVLLLVKWAAIWQECLSCAGRAAPGTAEKTAYEKHAATGEASLPSWNSVISGN